MNIVNYLILALLQGVTEFIPVSSSGHLVLFQQIFGFEKPMLFFDIMLHLATSLAVIVFLRKELILISKDSFSAIGGRFKGKSWPELWQQFYYFKLGVLVMLAIIPAIIIGVTLNGFIEKLFVSVRAVGVTFIITGSILFFTKYISPKRKIETLNARDALFIGIAQAVAIIPGLSRSGLTIATGIFRGLDKKLAARFSFILSVPTILAAAVYKLSSETNALQISTGNLILSFIAAFLSGYIALVILSKMIARAKFHYFSYYCWTIGIISMALSVFCGKT